MILRMNSTSETSRIKKIDNNEETNLRQTSMNGREEEVRGHMMEFFPLFKTVAPSEIKEEPVQIKEEPIDEFVDINQEKPVFNVSSTDTAKEIKEEPQVMNHELIDHFKQEEPIIDMYCPSTGESRPIHSTNVDSGLSMDCDETAVWQIVATEIDGNDSTQWKDCFICRNLCSKFYELPKREGQRRAFFDRIIVEGLSRGALARLHGLFDTQSEAHFCPTHIATKTFHPSADRFLEFHRKKFDRKNIKNTVPPRVEASTGFSRREVEKRRIEEGREEKRNFENPKCIFPIRKKLLFEQKVCYLCNKMTDKFHSTPENSEERIEFLNRIMLTRKTDEERVAALVNKRIRVYFCQMHVANWPIRELSQKANGLSTEAYEPFYKLTPRIFTETPIPERYHTKDTPRIFIDAPPNSNSVALPNPVRIERELNRPQPSLFAQIYASSRRQVNRRVCIVCNRMQNEHEMRVFTKDQKKRPLWVNAVRSTAEGRRLLMEKLCVVTTAYLCESHFSPSDVDLPMTCADHRRNLQNDAVPSYELYACLFCGAQFTQKTDAKRHLINNPGHRTPKPNNDSNTREEPIEEQPGPSRNCY